MENLTEIAARRGLKIVIKLDPLCWEAGLDVTPDTVSYSLVRGGDTVMEDGSLAAVGKWLTSGLPIGAYCPRPGLYGSSCGHREIKMEHSKPFPPCPKCIEVWWSPVPEPRPS